jgi:hypothetical protein
MDFPASCLRGIRKQNQITPEGGVSAEVFYPDRRTAENRKDGGAEISINWEDEETVLVFTLEFKVGGQYQFPHGAVRLALSEIDRINRLPSSTGALTYERTPLPDNPHHGNIVFRAGLSKPMERMVAATLALAASTVFQRRSS